MLLRGGSEAFSKSPRYRGPSSLETRGRATVQPGKLFRAPDIRSARLAATTLPGMPPNHRGRFVLDDYLPARFSYFGRPASTVRPHAGKHHRQHVRTIGLSHRAEQYIHRGTAGILLRVTVDPEHELSPLAPSCDGRPAQSRLDRAAISALPCLPAPRAGQGCRGARPAGA